MDILKGNDWDNYFMDVAYMVAKRASCLSAAKGAVIVRNNKFIVSTGYNGAPMGIVSCKEKGLCFKRHLGYNHGEGHHVCIANHAEENAIIIAARLGVSTEGTTMYCTHKPCFSCAKIIINAGIKKVVFVEDYPDKYAEEILQNVGIRLYQLKK